nr:unnamed protein product [Callosobruchus chinensis]
MKGRHQFRRRFSLQPSFLKEEPEEDHHHHHSNRTASTPGDPVAPSTAAVRHKIVVMGAAKVGKSSIISQFLYGVFSSKYKRTVEEMHHGDFNVAGVDTATTESVVTVDWENGFVEASAKDNVNITQVFKELLVQAKVKYNLTLTNNMASSDDSDAPSTSIIKNPKKSYGYKYKADWEKIPEFQSWIRPSNQGITYFNCSACGKDYIGGIAAVKKHNISLKHVKRLNAVKQQKSVTEMKVFKQQSSTQKS